MASILTAKLGDLSTRDLIRSNVGDCVLVNRLQLCVVLDFALEVHLSEHVQRRLLALLASAGVALGLHGSDKLPASLAALETESLAVVAGSNNLVFSLPEQALEWQKLGRDAQDGLGGLLRAAGVHDGDAAVMRSKSKSVSAGRKGHRVHPTSGVVQVLSADGVEGQSLTPDTRLGTLIDTLDKGRQHSGMGIGRAGGEKHGVWVPSNAGDGTADRLLQVANGNDAVTGAHGKLGLGRGPSNEGGGTADSKKNEGGLVSGRRRLPDQSVSVCEIPIRIHDGKELGAGVAARSNLGSKTQCGRCSGQYRHW
jgi:hypothetical protein